MTPLTTTLNAIREHSPCEKGWTKLLAHLGKTKADAEPLLFETILDNNGLDDALWCLRALDQEHQRTCRLFAVWCARQVQHLMEDPHKPPNSVKSVRPVNSYQIYKPSTPDPL